MRCIVCKNRIEEHEDKILVGVDGDFIHKKCQHELEKHMTRINNMSDTEFERWLKGE